LCGPPGAGKSTVAPLLAALLGRNAIDVDERIEAAERRPIADIVDEDGEARFRQLERETILGTTLSDAVVALGGGALEDASTREVIAKNGILVFLDASLETCAERTAAQAGRRPLLRDPDALARLYAQRRPRYAAASIRVAVDGLAPNAAAAAVYAALNDRRVVHVATPKPYDVAIGAGVLDDLPERVRPADGGQLLIVADVAVRPIAERIMYVYSAFGFQPWAIFVTADESLKSLERVGELYAEFSAQRLDRRSLVIGVGGGTIADAVGFAAATYQRGIPYAAVPTTLLAAVDAAIGGKTAINLPAGKNLVGTITQPVHVAIAPHVLRALPQRDIVSGYGEMLKYGLALDAELYRALRAGETALLDDPATALDAIARCVELKAELVADDEEDRTGARAILNFGHTVGHAIEKVAGYGVLRHGEAVIVGMRAALALSSNHGALDRAERAEADAHLAALPVPPDWRGLEVDAVIAATRSDKKRHAGGTQFVLLDRIGGARLDDTIHDDDVRFALREIGFA
jgi:3-dehydroquinate synthase